MKKSRLFFAALALSAHLLSFGQPGTLDPSFDPGTGIEYYVYASAVQTDGKIIIGGDFDFYDGTAFGGIVRVHADGSIDASFDTGTGLSSTAKDIDIQDDGKIIIGGGFLSFNGVAQKSIVRLNTDGSLDTSFDPGIGVSGNVYDVCVQPDGKILMAGQFSYYGATMVNEIVRANADGTIDPTFNVAIGVNDAIKTMSLQSDGKIIIAGEFINYNGTPINHIARLNADGTLDTSFDPGTGTNGYVECSAIQSDGKIILGGLFYEFNGTTTVNIVRLNTDGSLDTSFDPGAGASSEVRTMAIQNNGKIIIGGYFSSYDGVSRNNIARINSDGSLDTTFDPGTGANNDVLTIALQNDGRFIIGGIFTTYNGTAINRVARINYSPVGLNEMTTDLSFDIYPNPFSTQATFHTDIALQDATLSLYNTFGQVVKQINGISSQTILLPAEDLPAGVYFVRLEENGKLLVTGEVIVKE